jgi:hypothetical protein
MFRKERKDRIDGSFYYIRVGGAGEAVLRV